MVPRLLGGSLKLSPQGSSQLLPSKSMTTEVILLTMSDVSSMLCLIDPMMKLSYAGCSPHA